MKIYISARPFVPGKSGGIVSYMENLVTAMAAMPGLELHTGHTYSNLHEIGGDWPAAVRCHPLHGIDITILAAAEATLIDRLAPDWVLYFYPFYHNHHPQNGRTRVATCIPDIQHVHLGANFTEVERRDRDNHFTEASERSDLIFTLSDFCRTDITRYYPRSARKIFTVHPAAPHAWDNPADDGPATRERLHLPDRFILYNANPWSHKNHDALLAALQRLGACDVVVPCVFTGADSHGVLAGKIAAAGLGATVKSLGYVDQDALKHLMAAADILVYPSLFEGFGIPILEAFGSGLPVACSNVCSLPEVGGDAAEYFDPTNPEDIARAIELLWSEAEVHAACRARGLLRYREFSYEKSAAVLVNLLAQDAPALRVTPEIVVHEPKLVSIVTPSFQQGRFLKDCIESVLTQDYPHVEYLVFDGGSTDESVSILKSHGERFHWQSQPDGGQTKAINSGLARARGSILAYLNSDDVLLPGAVSRIVDAFGSHPSADLIYGTADYIDEAGRVTHPYPTHPYDRERLKGLCYICQPAAFWTRRAWQRYGEFDDSFHFAMDYEYWQRMAARRAFLHYIPEKLASSRDYATTKTRGQRQKVFEDIFASQRKHWNHIHLNWWLGYVDYLAKEAPWWVRLRTPRSSARQHELALRLERENDHRPAPTAANATTGEPRTTGIFNDGWLSAGFKVALNNPRERPIYLDIFAPWPGLYSLVVNGQAVATHQAGGLARLKLETRLPQGDCTISLTGPAARLSEADPRQTTALLVGANWF